MKITFSPKKKALDHIKPVIWRDRTLLIEFYVLVKCISSVFFII